MMLNANVINRLLKISKRKFCRDPFVITPESMIGQISDSGAASIDLRLGCWFVSMKKGRISMLEIENGPNTAKIAKTHYVRFGDTYILHPQTFTLAVTLEWMRIPSYLGGYIIGRSSWGRRGLVIATAAGIHPGFTGCLTLELCNIGEVPIELQPGRSICQLFVHRVEKRKNIKLDASKHIGYRKPNIGQIGSDDITDMLNWDYVKELWPEQNIE